MLGSKTIPPLGQLDSADFSLAALKTSVSFAWASRRALFILAFVPLSVEFLTRAYLHYNPVDRHQMFLIGVAINLSNAWFIAAALLFTVKKLKTEWLSLREISGLVLRHLPKIFFSYALLVLLIGVAMFLPPAFVVVCFALWAPAYCVLEILGEQANPRKPSGEEEPEEYQSEFSPGAEQIEFASFHGHSWWDIGFIRSLHLVGLNFSLTLKVFLCAWVAAVLPAALSYLFFKPPFGLLAYGIQFTLGAFLAALFAGLWSYTFLLILPDRARQELFPGLESQEMSDLLRSEPVRQGAGKLLLPVMFVLAGAASYFHALHSISSIPMPQSAIIQVENHFTDGKDLVLDVYLQDEVNYLRWVELDKFVVIFHQGINPRSVDGFSRESGNAEDVKFRSERLLARNSEGQILDPAMLVPSKEPVLLSFRFPIPRQKDFDSFSLIYRQEGDKQQADKQEVEPIFTAKLDSTKES